MTKPTNGGPYTEAENTGDPININDYMHPEENEGFLNKPSKVVEVLQFLEEMATANQLDNKDKTQLEDLSNSVTDTNFLVCKRIIYTDRISAKRSKSKNKISGNTNQFTFMRQINETLQKRVAARIERERVAESFRRMGNYEYRRNSFASAIQWYTKGLGYIIDTPVLYVNRALCYIKQRQFKRGIMDCDHVIEHIDKKCLRAWLYRALAYNRLNDDKNYEYSVYQANSLNSSETQYIQTFFEKIRTIL